MKYRYLTLIVILLVALTSFVALFSVRNDLKAQIFSKNVPQLSNTNGNAASYLYYTLKQTTGFVLARAPKGVDNQPLSTPQIVAHFSDGFGLAESDSVISMQLSPDGHYLAIDGNRDHGEQVWMYDTRHMTISLTPNAVLGNFLHWLPGSKGHTFLYRPMLPLGPQAPLDSVNGWNPGLWMVDASTGTFKNIDISVPSAFLVDAAPSPDGSHIIYSISGGLGMGSDTWLMKLDGSARIHLFHTVSGAQSIAGLFAWSPDGRSIAYERLSDSPTPFLPAGLWLMSSFGGQQRRLADTDGGHGFAPVWSPDSSKIAFIVRTNVSNRLADRNKQALQSAIAVVNVQNGRTQIVASPAQTGMQINTNPQWSSEGINQAGPRITFIAYNPINNVIGGTPRYWSAHIDDTQARSRVTPLTPAMSHVVSVG